MMKSVLEMNIADNVLTGGLLGNVMLTAYGIDIGKASVDFTMSYL